MIIVGLVLVLSVGFYYIKTSSILRKTSRDSIVRELNQVNDTIQDQVETIDSIIRWKIREPESIILFP